VLQRFFVFFFLPVVLFSDLIFCDGFVGAA